MKLCVENCVLNIVLLDFTFRECILFNFKDNTSREIEETCFTKVILHPWPSKEW